jgi:hypothetical protein
MLSVKTKTQKILFLVILLDLILILLHLIWGRGISFVNLDLEYNLPTFYSGFKLVLIGSLAFLGYLKNDLIDRAHYWLVLGAIFIYLGVDEVLELHERIAHYISNQFLSELGWYDNEVFYWTIIFTPLIILAVVFLITFYQKILASNSRSRKYFLFGLILFVLVIISEIVGGIFTNTNLGYHIMTLEESFEIFGTTFFLGAILRYLESMNSKPNRE